LGRASSKLEKEENKKQGRVAHIQSLYLSAELANFFLEYRMPWTGLGQGLNNKFNPLSGFAKTPANPHASSDLRAGFVSSG